MGWDGKGKGRRVKGLKVGRGGMEWDKSCMICIKNLNKLSGKTFY